MRERNSKDFCMLLCKEIHSYELVVTCDLRNDPILVNFAGVFLILLLFQDTLFSKQVTTLSFWPILPLYKLQMLAQQLRGTHFNFLI
jgi:hypothetical protein